MQLPKKGQPAEEVLGRMREAKEKDADWRAGKTWSLIYPAGEEVDYTTFCRKVMNRDEMENPFAWLGRFTEMRDQNINREQMQFGKRISIWGHGKASRGSVRSTVY